MPLSLLPCPGLAPLVLGTSIFVKFAGMGGYYARIVTGIISAETFTAIGPGGSADDHYVHFVDSIDCVIAAGARGGPSAAVRSEGVVERFRPMPTAAQINDMLDEAAEVVDEQGLSLAVAPYSWLGGPSQPMQSATPVPLMVQGGLGASGVLAAADAVTTVGPSRANGARKDPRIAQPIQVIADDRANEVGKIRAITDMRVPQFGDVVEPKDIVVGTVVGTDYRQALCLIDGMHMLVDEILCWGKYAKIWWRLCDPARL